MGKIRERMLRKDIFSYGNDNMCCKVSVSAIAIRKKRDPVNVVVRLICNMLGYPWEAGSIR